MTALLQELASCFADLLILFSFLHSKSACFNETIFIITDNLCGLAAVLDSIGFSEMDQQSGCMESAQ